MTTKEQIAQTAANLGVPPSIALAVAQKESGFNQSARGAAGEIGIFQIMPATARGLKVNPADQSQNIQGGISLLAQLYSQFGSWSTALAHYNGGNNPPASSWRYAQSVLDQSEVYGLTDVGSERDNDPALASVVPDLSGVPNWAWLAAVGIAGVLVLLKRD